MKLCLVVIVIFSLLLGMPAGAQKSPQAKSIILLIGDGMGTAHTDLASRYAREVVGAETLALETIQTRASTTTFSADNDVTDSAAAGTAIHSGYKVDNKSVNVLPGDGGLWLYTIGQAAQDAGKSVGVVTTTSLTDATPATVYAHMDRREDQNMIAEQLVAFAPQVALGAGWRYFVPQSESGSQREDDRNLLGELAAGGYTLVSTVDELKAVDTEKTDYLAGFFARTNMAYTINRMNGSDPEEPSLAEMVTAALAVLDNDPDGFFLMAEGGLIDRAAHAHDAAALIHEVLSFDEAVAVALQYQAAHPDVLVVVTADHETGGIDLTQAPVNVAALAPIKCGLQAELDPVSADEAVGKARACGFDLTDTQTARLLKYPPDTPLKDLMDETLSLYESYTWGLYVFSEIETEMSGITWTTWGHTGVPIITYVRGPGETLFGGSIDNTDIAWHMADILGVTLKEPYPAK